MALTSLPNNRLMALEFLLWLYVASVVMIFAGLSSALIVAQADAVAAESWEQLQVPGVFVLSTATLLLSSLTGHLAVGAAQRDQTVRVRNLVAATFVLGVVFLTSQFMGFQNLVAQGVYLADHSSGQYLYVITGMHGLHLFGGLAALLYQLVRAIQYRIHSRNILGLQLSVRFWHALDAIWIYLYVFLLYNFELYRYF